MVNSPKSFNADQKNVKTENPACRRRRKFRSAEPADLFRSTQRNMRASRQIPQTGQSRRNFLTAPDFVEKSVRRLCETAVREKACGLA